MHRTKLLIAHGVLSLSMACSEGSTIDGDPIVKPANFKLLNAPSGTRGELLEGTHIVSLSQAELNQRFASRGVSARNGVHIYKLTYRTVTPGNASQPIVASGIIVIPDAAQPLYPWMSLQHGTITGKADAPSVTPSEGVLEGSQGFVTVVMDYLGRGSASQVFPPYLIAEAYANAGVDMLKAAKTFASQSQLQLGPLFLKGYSEGGYATLALQKNLETNFATEFPIVASAPAAGPYDVETTSRELISEKFTSPATTPFVVLSYNNWLASTPLDLNKIFLVEPARIKTFFSGAFRTEDVLRALPQETRLIYRSELIDDLLSETPVLPESQQLDTWFEEQSLHNKGWVPRAPTRFYHCETDETVPVEATLSAVKSFKEQKSDAPVNAIIIPSPAGAPAYTHTTCPGIFASLQWFGEILSQSRNSR